MRRTKTRVQPSKPGRVNCLKCGKQFKSPDRISVRICNKCKGNSERFGLIGEKASSVGGLDRNEVSRMTDMAPEADKPPEADV